MNTSNHIAMIRELANTHSSVALEVCIQSAVDKQHNPCYVATAGQEETISVLAKAQLVRSLMDGGMTDAQAVRELGRRIRKFQTNLLA